MFEGHPFRDAPARRLLSARIKPHQSRFARFIGVGVIAAFFNVGIIWQFVSAVRLGPGSAIVFMSVFLIIGFLLLGTAVHAFLSMFNPTVEILASTEHPVLGEPLDLQWRLTGKAARVRSLQIHLEGAEEATYQRGTDSTTERHPFVHLEVATLTDPKGIAQGSATVVIPRDAAATFTAKNNKIVWRIVVEGEIPNWPDIDDAFPVEVVWTRRGRAKAAA